MVERVDNQIEPYSGLDLHSMLWTEEWNTKLNMQQEMRQSGPCQNARTETKWAGLKRFEIFHCSDVGWTYPVPYRIQ